MDPTEPLGDIPDDREPVAYAVPGWCGWVLLTVVVAVAVWFFS